MSLFCSSLTIEGYFQISIKVVPFLYLRVTLNSSTSLTRSSSKHINISPNPFVNFLSLIVLCVSLVSNFVSVTMNMFSVSHSKVVKLKIY